MAKLIKAELAANKKRMNMIKIAIVAAVSVIGLMLAAVSVINSSFLFATAYFIGGILGVMYTVIKINSTFPQSVVCDGEKLIIRRWENGFFPYVIDFRPRFFADFVPAKTITEEIKVSDIKDMAIGTKAFLSRAVKDFELDKRINDVSAVNRRLASVMKRSDILYIRLNDDRMYVMSVTDFDVDALYRIVDIVEHIAAGLEFKTNIRLLRRKREVID
ncbi:MAG: hypothetical protein KIG65_02960 [Eubacteriales bacterium]|nr:hypothetical protein [Eubacteriales bacterium]